MSHRYFFWPCEKCSAFSKPNAIWGVSGIWHFVICWEWLWYPNSLSTWVIPYQFSKLKNYLSNKVFCMGHLHFSWHFLLLMVILAFQIYLIEPILLHYNRLFTHLSPLLTTKLHQVCDSGPNQISISHTWMLPNYNIDSTKTVDQLGKGLDKWIVYFLFNR